MATTTRTFFSAAVLVAAVLLVSVVPGPAAGAVEEYPLDDTLRLNHVQHVGSHNSYRERAHWPIPLLISLLDYGHAPLSTQLGLEGVRALELDIFATAGGSFRVLHIPVVDERSTCASVVACLGEVKAWSDANPSHAPMFVQIEPKDDLSTEKVADHYDELDDAIRSVLPPEKLITPDDVRGAHASLVDAMAAEGWPSLGETRGKFLFFLDVGSGPLTDKYLDGHPELAGRVAFPNGQPGESWSVVFVKNNPLSSFAEIQGLVSSGYIVRTRADDDIVPEPAQTAAALASGAQILSTDFESPGHVSEGDWSVSIPGGTPSGCNPVSAPPECAPSDIETGVWEERPQRLQIGVTGSISWSVDVVLDPETFVVGVPGDDYLYQLSGEAVVPGASGGDAHVSVEAKPLLGLPLYLGSIGVSDPGAGVEAELPLLFVTFRRVGSNGAATSTGWCSFDPDILGCGQVSVSLETV